MSRIILRSAAILGVLVFLGLLFIIGSLVFAVDIREPAPYWFRVFSISTVSAGLLAAILAVIGFVLSDIQEKRDGDPLVRRRPEGDPPTWRDHERGSSGRSGDDNPDRKRVDKQNVEVGVHQTKRHVSRSPSLGSRIRHHRVGAQVEAPRPAEGSTPKRWRQIAPIVGEIRRRGEWHNGKRYFGNYAGHWWIVRYGGCYGEGPNKAAAVAMCRRALARRRRVAG